MDSDIAELLRPSTANPDLPLDVQDVKRRVRRRRRSRTAAVVAIVVIAIPLAWQQFPDPMPDVVFSPSDGAAVGDGGSGEQPDRHAEGEADTAIQAVLARADVALEQTRPARGVIGRAQATEAAARYVGAPADDADGAAYGSATESGGLEYQTVWVVRFDMPSRQRGGPRGASGGAAEVSETTVVLVDAKQGDVIFSVSASDDGDGQHGASMSAPLGSGSMGGSAAAQRGRYTGRGPTPRAAALDAADTVGRRDLRVQSVFYIAETDTRVLIHDTTGCWVYSAVKARGDAWRANGGTVPCDP